MTNGPVSVTEKGPAHSSAMGAHWGWCFFSLCRFLWAWKKWWFDETNCTNLLWTSFLFKYTSVILSFCKYKNLLEILYNLCYEWSSTKKKMITFFDNKKYNIITKVGIDVISHQPTWQWQTIFESKKLWTNNTTK